MDRNIDSILSRYTVADADDAFLERVMQRVEAHQNAALLRRRTQVHALMFASALLSGIWTGNVSAGRTAVQMQTVVATQYKYLAQITFGPASFNDFLL